MHPRLKFDFSLTSTRLGAMLSLTLFLLGCSPGGGESKLQGGFKRPPDFRLPRAVILATNDGAGFGSLGDGVLLAYEALNRHGLPTQIMDRSLLADSTRLHSVGLILAGTLYGYHDADHRFSLTYMDDDQINRISDWIVNGGVLIAGENFARNTRAGMDRVFESGQLTPQNWTLGKTMAFSLTERELNGYQLEMDNTPNLDQVWERAVKAKILEPTWLLVPSGNSDYPTGVYPIAHWVKGVERIPAAWAHKMGQGWFFYFTDFRLLHPEIDGGVSSPAEIDRFYARIIQLVQGHGPGQTTQRPYLALAPWPHDHPAALVISINCEGDESNLRPLVESVVQQAGGATLFVNDINLLEATLPTSLLERLEVASLSRAQESLSKMDQQIAREMIPSVSRKEALDGFRFPRLEPTYNLLQHLDYLGYVYDSSLPVNHQQYYNASLYPYQFPLHTDQDGLGNLHLLELGPIYRDDWSFYGEVQGSIPQKAALYEDFLINAWQQVFLPQQGLMVQIGDPRFMGENDLTLAPVLHLLERAKRDGAWLTDLKSVAQFWQIRQKAHLDLWEESGRYVLRISAEGENLAGLTIHAQPPKGKLFKKVLASSPESQTRLNKDGSYTLICGAGALIEFTLITK